ncbi:DoxX family protein [Saccharothrix variisporea]|uniref:DoxX family protein n=1 Tax=Saccharothrix variisporea TaxID=543527 RepID=UPI001FEA0313|nr:DoxX family protein [Saccharothrix variisporea]
MVVIGVTVVANLVAAAVDFGRSKWVLKNMAGYGLPASWIVPLGLVKAAGAVGLLAGFVVPVVGVAAAVGLVLYFVGAVAVVVRARVWRDVGYPTAFLALAVASLVVA